jgi:hypothetical protein
VKENPKSFGVFGFKMGSPKLINYLADNNDVKTLLNFFLY